MLTVPEAQSAQFLPHSSPPTIEAAAETAPLTAAQKCDANTCPWWPYSSSKDFKTNAGLIVLILFVAVVCALALNAAVRYIFRNRRQSRRTGTRGLEEGQPKPAPSSSEARVVEPPAVVFTAGMKLAGAEAECAICLSEFVEGEGIRVMEKCKHGFHVQCIRKWLNSRSSCPTCRTICCARECSAAGEVTAGCSSGNGAHRDLESGGSERGPQTPLV